MQSTQDFELLLIRDPVRVCILSPSLPRVLSVSFLSRAPLLPQAYDRIGVDSFGSPSDYKKYGEDHGLELLEYSDQSSNLAPHYKLVM